MKLNIKDFSKDVLVQMRLVARQFIDWLVIESAQVYWSTQPRKIIAILFSERHISLYWLSHSNWKQFRNSPTNLTGKNSDLQWPTVSTTKDLKTVLNTRLNAEDNVVSAANKAHRVPFYLKRSFAALTPSFFPPVQNVYSPVIQATHLILFLDAKALEKVQKLTMKFVKGSACPVWSSHQTASSILPRTPANP